MDENDDFEDEVEELIEATESAVCQDELKRRSKELFRLWAKRLLISSYAHYLAAERCEIREKWLLIINISTAILVLFFNANRAVLETLSQVIGMDETAIGLVVSLLSVLVVLSSAAQYILQYGTSAALHKLAGSEFSNLRRKIECYWTKGNLHPEAIHNLNRAYNMVNKTTPLVPPGIWPRAVVAKEKEVAEVEEAFFNGKDANR